MLRSRVGKTVGSQAKILKKAGISKRSLDPQAIDPKGMRPSEPKAIRTIGNRPNRHKTIRVKGEKNPRQLVQQACLPPT